MNRDEYLGLTRRDVGPVVLGVSELVDPWENRTLLYGYYVSRNSLHVYVKDNAIHTVRYDHNEKVLEHRASYAFPAGQLMPDKRVYAEATDREFVVLLRSKGLNPTFTTWDMDRYRRFEAMDTYKAVVCYCGLEAGSGRINDHWALPEA